MRLYWQRDESDPSGCCIFTLRGWTGLSTQLDVPVCHISLYEADAFARWKGCRLPTEAEWECVASESPVQGNLFDSGKLHLPKARGEASSNSSATAGMDRCHTDGSGYKPLLGEYNGKFMSGQMVLWRPCVTPADHIRRLSKLFQPETRWQFAGLRLAI